MKLRKILFDVLFIVISATILFVLNQYGLLEHYFGFALIPILMAYYLGQYSSRKFQE